MRTLLLLLEKEFKQIFRDAFLPKLIIFLPVMQLLILPLAADFEMKNIQVAYVDHDSSPLSQRLIGKIKSSGYFRLLEASSTYSQALVEIEKDRADVVVEIPVDFEKQLVSQGKSSLFLAANTVNSTKGAIGVAYLSTVVQDFSQEIGAEISFPSPAGASQLDARISFRYNPRLNYTTFMVPGIIVMLLSIIGGFLSALNIVSEKEKGTIEQMHVSPVRREIFILGKLIPFWIIGFFVLSLCLLTARVVYGLSPVGSIGVIYLFSGVYLLAFTGMGLVISNYSSTQQQAMFMSFFFIIIIILMSGFFTPISSMPDWAHFLTFFNPMRYFMEVIRLVFLKGSSCLDVWPQLAITTLFAVVLNVWAVLSHKLRS